MKQGIHRIALRFLGDVVPWWFRRL